MEPTTSTEPKAKGNWWTRNWKWFVPTGCLTILALFLVFVADLAIPISGPKGKGTIYVKAAKSLGRWTYSDLIVEIQATRNRIDLLKGSAPANEF